LALYGSEKIKYSNCLCSRKCM